MRIPKLRSLEKSNSEIVRDKVNEFWEFKLENNNQPIKKHHA